MNGVAVIDRVTIDCIFSGMAGFPGAGEELYTDRFSMTLGGGACVTPVRLGNMGVPVRYGTFLGQGLLSKTAENLLQKYKVQNLHNFYDGDGEPVIFSSVFSFPSDRSIMTFDAGLGENLLTDAQVYDFLHGADVCFAPRRPDVVKKLAREGTKIVYDTHWEEGQTLEDHLPILRLADFFTPNDKEAMLLTDTDSPQAALDALCNYTAQPIVRWVRTAVLPAFTARRSTSRQGRPRRWIRPGQGIISWPGWCLACTTAALWQSAFSWPILPAASLRRPLAAMTRLTICARS